MVAKEISSLQHPKVKELISLRLDKRIREERKQVLLIGRKMVLEIAKKVRLTTLITSEKTLSIQAQEHILVTPEILQKITSLPSTDGVIAVAPMPQPSLPPKIKKILILDRLQDPGNLGTLLRTALALNWDGAIFTPGTVDPFNDKALRASKGALFSLPYQFLHFEEIIFYCEERKITSYVADLGGTPVAQMAPSFPLALILSNEGSGPTKIPEKWAQKIEIPMHNGVDSLNVATSGAILLYLLGEP